MIPASSSVGLVAPAALTFTDEIAEYGELFGAVVTTITGNQYLSLFLFGGLMAMIWRHFKKAKKAVR